MFTVSGFLTPPSTQPLTIRGRITNNNLTYFYFNGYDLTMLHPREFSVISLSPGSTVWHPFPASLTLSDISPMDIIQLPSTHYPSQPQCPPSIECLPQQRIRVLSTSSVTVV